MRTETSYDIIVAGGGIAGVAAAVTAARLGARTLLVERYGFLGGMATAGLVNPFMTSRTSDGKPLIAGFFSDLLGRLADLDGLKRNTFDSEAMKLALQEMALEAGAELLLHSWIAAPIIDGGAIRGVRIINKSGEREYHASRVVDATGDGDVAAAAGAPYEIGGSQTHGRRKDSSDSIRQDSGRMKDSSDSIGQDSGRRKDSSDSIGQDFPQAMTMMLDVGGVDMARVMAYVRDHPDQMRFPKLPPDAEPEELARGVVSVAGYYDLVAQAKERGEYPLPGDLVFFISRPRPGEVVFNTTHVGGVTGTNADDLTRAEIEGRRQAAALVRFVKNHIPGFENAHLLRMATQIGVRETRRIMGEYIFSADDVISARKFDDAIARLAYPVDVHSGKGEGYTRTEERSGPVGPPAGDWYEIPYRCLVPLVVENLLVAGRCVSSTQEGLGAIRIMPGCAAMGQAAGAAAALSIKGRVTPRELDQKSLLRALREQGALV